MKLYDKKPLYTSENGIFKRTNKFLYKPTKEGKKVATIGVALVLVIVVILAVAL